MAQTGRYSSLCLLKIQKSFHGVKFIFHGPIIEDMSQGFKTGKPVLNKIFLQAIVLLRDKTTLQNSRLCQTAV